MSSMSIPPNVPLPECTSLTKDVVVPGLHLMEDFLSEEEERELLERYCGDDAPWEVGMNRRVIHMGFTFNYRTLLLDYTKEVEPIPNELFPHWETRIKMVNPKLREMKDSLQLSDAAPVPNAALGESLLPIAQCTVNEYLPGQGIAPHVDNEICFGPDIYILSLGQSLTMTLHNRRSGVKKHLWVPRRSLLILSDEARWSWKHGIASRKFDMVNGELVSRTGRRVSLTFRTVRQPGELPSACLQSSELEQNHVFRVYDEIAVHWNHTRGRRKVYWHRVKEFLEALPQGSLIADVGSGDGKYFGVAPGSFVVGCDRSWNLLQVSKETAHETFCCDAVKLPFQCELFDATLCIAVLHHLGSVDRRIAVVRELVRITRTGGEVMLQAWAQEQEEGSRHRFIDKDVMVPWRLQTRFFQEHQQLLNDNKSEENELKEAIGGKEAVEGRDEVTACAKGFASVGAERAPPVSDDTEAMESQSKTTRKRRKHKKNQLPQQQQNKTVHQVVCGSVESPTENAVKGEPVRLEEGALVYQRYCHVYSAGELEDLCSSVPNCRVVESGWDRGNWFVRLVKVCDPRLVDAPLGPPAALALAVPRVVI